MTSKPLKIILADDERTAREGLASMLQDLSDDHAIPLEIIGKASDGSEALKLVQKLSPDLVFLDIQMPMMTGLEVLDVIRGGDYEVVFVTAFDKFAVKAFEQEALDYLLKPFTSDRLLESMKRAVQRLKERRATEDKTELSGSPERLLAKRDGKVCIVPTDEILAIEASSNYAYVHTVSQSYSVRATLAALSQRLASDTFIRTHKSYIVRIDAISEMAKVGGGDVELTLTDRTKIPLSRTYRAAFEERLGKIP